MPAFVTSAPLLAGTVFQGANCRRTTCRDAAPRAIHPTTMMAKSNATPFWEAQPNLAGWVGDQASFDPLGISNLVDMRFLREAEIKHSRVAMIAFLGLLVPEFYKFPIYADAPGGLQAVHDWGVNQGSMAQLLLWISGLEIITGVPALSQMMSGSERQPGEFGFDPLHLRNKIIKNHAYAELVNGRLAMIVTGAIIHHEFVTGKGPVDFVLNGFVPKMMQ